MKKVREVKDEAGDGQGDAQDASAQYDVHRKVVLAPFS